MFMGRKKLVLTLNELKKLLKKNSKNFIFLKVNKIGEKINKRYLKFSYDYIFCFRSFYI